MPALSYKERFCPFIKDYSKTQTIRAFRKRMFIKGDKLMHYYAMRTIHCKKLIPDTIATNVQTIIINTIGQIFIHDAVISEATAKQYMKQFDKEKFDYKSLKFTQLSVGDKNMLAYNDGFRPEEMETTPFKLMFRWFNQTHSLPFCGQIIKWERP